MISSFIHNTAQRKNNILSLYREQLKLSKKIKDDYVQNYYWNLFYSLYRKNRYISDYKAIQSKLESSISIKNMMHQALEEDNQNQLQKMVRISLDMSIFVKNSKFAQKEISKQNQHMLSKIDQFNSKHIQKHQKKEKVLLQQGLQADQWQLSNQQQQVLSLSDSSTNNTIEQNDSFKQQQIQSQFSPFIKNPAMGDPNLNYSWKFKLMNDPQFKNKNLQQQNFIYYTILKCLKPNVAKKSYTNIVQYLEDDKSERYEQFDLSNTSRDVLQYIHLKIYLNHKYKDIFKQLFLIDDFDQSELIPDFSQEEDLELDLVDSEDVKKNDIFSKNYGKQIQQESYHEQVDSVRLPDEENDYEFSNQNNGKNNNSNYSINNNKKGKKTVSQFQNFNNNINNNGTPIRINYSQNKYLSSCM